VANLRSNTAKRLDFTRYIASLVEASARPQNEISLDAGFINANVVTQLKQGAMRLPADRIVSFARALGEDPRVMLRRWLVTYEPGLLAGIDAYLVCKIVPNFSPSQS
jgi:hypothetical protein